MPSFVKKNTLEQTAFALTSDGFEHSGRSFKFSDVVETSAIRVIHMTRHVPIGVTTAHDPGISVLFTMRTGEKVQLTEQSTFFSDSKVERVEKIQGFFDLICEKTFDYRVLKYTSQVTSQGYFEYSGWRFFPSQSKMLKIETQRAYSLQTAKLLRSYGFIEVKDDGEGIFAQIAAVLYRGPTGIDTLVDTDVFFALLKHYFQIAWN